MMGKSIKSALVLLVFLLNLSYPANIRTSKAQSSETNLTINGGVAYQTINGVGSNIHSWSWKGGELRPALDILVDTLGHNMFRVVHDRMDWAGTGDIRPAATLSNLQNLDQATLISIYEAPDMQDLWDTIAYLNSKGIAGEQIIVNFMGWTAEWMGGHGYNMASFIYDNDQTNQDIATMIASLVYYGHHRRDVSGTNQNLEFRFIAPFNEIDYNGIEGPLMDEFQMNRIYERIVTTLTAMGDMTTKLNGPDSATSPDSYTSAYSPIVLSRMTHFSWHAYSTIPFTPATSRGGIHADWMTERSVWCEECNNNLPPVQGEWAYGSGIGDIVLGDIENGFSAVLTWEGFDSFYYHDGRYAAWGHLGCTQNGSGCTTSDTYPRVYTIRGRAWPEATIAAAIRPGMVRRRLTTTLPNLLALSFYNATTGSFSIVGHNKGPSEITIDGQLQNLPAIDSLSFYKTNASNNLHRMNDVPVTGNQFTATIPADTFFSLNYPDIPTETSLPIYLPLILRQ